MVHSNKSSLSKPSKKMESLITKPRRREKGKLKRKISQVFSQLRRKASIANQSLNNTVIDLDDSNLSNLNNTVVVIDDDPQSMYTSTPKKSTSLDKMILSANNKILEDSNNNRTRIINDSSFNTVDLTGESGMTDRDCFVTSISQGSSMSGDSDVTVLRRPTSPASKSAMQLINNLKNLNSRKKDRMLETLVKQLVMRDRTQPRALETAEDTYIKDIIVAKKISRNSVGSNIYNPEKYVNRTGLRMVVIDGSNVAMGHGDNRVFSVRGLSIVIDYFLARGHAVKAFVPRFRNRTGKSSDPQQLIQLERQGHVIFTPSREVRGKLLVSYDDRYIIQCAAEFEGVVVSNDKFQDLISENARWARVIENRVLPFTWCNGMIMFPRDPLGRNGPNLEQFLMM